VLGQSAPAATTATSAYTVPAGTSTIISTITICNRGTEGASYRIAIRPAGATLATSHYIAYDALCSPSASAFITAGITIGATDVVTVYASTANLTFSLFGSEIQ